jgi:hypothetical protein
MAGCAPSGETRRALPGREERSERPVAGTDAVAQAGQSGGHRPGSGLGEPDRVVTTPNG